MRYVLLLTLFGLCAGCSPYPSTTPSPLFTPAAPARPALRRPQIDVPGPEDWADTDEPTGSTPTGSGPTSAAAVNEPAQEAADWGVSQSLPPIRPIPKRQPEVRRLMYFTYAQREAPCVRETEELQALRAAGWRISTQEDQHVKIINYREHPDWFAQYNIEFYPTWVLLVDGQEDTRFEGWLSRKQIANFYSTGEPGPK